jgi:hypothetical protein
MSPRARSDRIRAAFARLIDADSRRLDELAAAAMAKVISGDTAALVCADRISRRQPSSIDKFVTAVTSSEAAPWDMDLRQVPKKNWEIQMANCSSKVFTCFAAALAVVVVSTGASVAEDAPTNKMDTQLLETLSTFQKKAAEASEAIIQNMGASKNADQSADQAQKFLESLSNFQKKAFGTTANEAAKQ